MPYLARVAPARITAQYNGGLFNNMRILFVTANRIGDAVLSTGLLAHLVKTHPDAKVTVVAGPAAAPLFRALPQLEQIISLEKRRFSAHWVLLWCQCIGRKWDIVVDLRRSLLAWLLLARRRYAIPKSSEKAHRVISIAATIPSVNPVPTPTVWTSDDDTCRARALLPACGRDGAAMTIAVAPAANWAGKQWRPERFAELVARLTDSGGPFPNAHIAVFAAGHERRQIQTVLDGVPANRLTDLVGKTDLTTAIACLQRCTFFIGNDSGLMHLAAAAGIPTLGLFGPSKTEHYSPWGEKAAAVRTTASFEELTTAPDYDHRTTGTLMDSLTVDAVLEAVTQLWQRTKGTAP